jgi:hypothetical protein
MKKINSLILLFILIISFSVLHSAFRSDCNNLHWGTKTTYQPLQKQYTPAPPGYMPVFINYVGRHGARHLTSITADSILFLVLKKAETENALTTAGSSLMRMDSLLLLVEKGNVSFISERGQEEQKGIGQRMAQNFPSVFNNNKGNIKISTTKKERTKQSAKAFMQGLNPDTTHSIINNFSDNDELAFYDISPAYKTFKESDSWKSKFAAIQNSEKAKKLYDELPELFFLPSFIKILNSGTLTFHTEKKDFVFAAKSFCDAFYDACSIVASLDKEMHKLGFKPADLDFKSLVPCSDLEELTYINSAEDFLLKGPGTDNSGIQVRIAAPLLISFMNSVDEYASSQKTIADLRFGHAETLAPFAALLDITGTSEALPEDKIQDYNKTWICENIIPLSSNIQWIFFKNKNKGDLLVKFMLNEKEVTINGISDSGTSYYYKWDDVREYYTKKLEKMNIHTGDNIHDYLINVK